jgi:hypothetical protein
LGSAPLLFRSGTFVNRLFSAGFLIAARFFTAGFLAPRFVAPLLFTRRLNAAQGAAERLNLTLIVELLAFSQFNQLLDFFHFIERLFQGLDNAAHVVRRFYDGGTGITALLPGGRRAVNRLPLERRLFHRRRGGSRRFNRGGFRSAFRRRRGSG